MRKITVQGKSVRKRSNRRSRLRIRNEKNARSEKNKRNVHVYSTSSYELSNCSTCGARTSSLNVAEISEMLKTQGAALRNMDKVEAREAARKCLFDAGLIDKEGKLKPPYAAS